LPYLNKYVNNYNVKILDINDCNKSIKQEFFDLVKNNYLNSGKMIYNPSETDIYSYFIGHSNKSYLSCYTEKNKLLSGLTSRPVNIKINGKLIITNYIDFLCTEINARNKKGIFKKKQNITPQTIYTFGYNTINSNINTFLFKREGEKNAIVPFIKYNCYLYNVEHFNIKHHHQLYKLTLITDDNIYLFLHNFSILLQGLFKNTIVSDLNNIKELINNNIIKCFILNNKTDIIGIYFFRNGSTKYNNKILYDFIGSFQINNKKSGISITNNLSEKDIEILFINNFYNCIDYLKKRENVKYILFEKLSHNNIIFNNLKYEYKFEYKIPYSYYLYNYVERTKKSENTFILC
jgi:hypothetical protein